MVGLVWKVWFGMIGKVWKVLFGRIGLFYLVGLVWFGRLSMD